MRISDWSSDVCSSDLRRNDPGNVMTGISLRLIPSEIDRVAAYAASLPGGRQHPVFREASLAERRDDPRSGASVPPPHEAGPPAAADRPGYGEHLPPQDRKSTRLNSSH